MSLQEEILNEQVTEGDRRKRMLGKLTEMLTKQNIDPADVMIKTVRVNEWQAMSKDEDGEPQVTDLKASSIVLAPTWESGPQWPVVQPVEPLSIKVPKAPASKLDGWKTCLILPDPQFGFRRDLETGDLDPFHDVSALDIALQIAERERPDLTIWLGDVLDFAMFGKYIQEPGFALTAQATINVAYEWIAKFVALSGETRLIEGNHDKRLSTAIIQNAVAAFGLRRAAAPPEEWPVLSVPNLLRFDELGVEYIGGYPSGATYVNDNLACIHGVKVGNSTRSAASVVVEDERVSVIMGHVHRIETRHKTRNSRGVPKFTFAHTPGTLARIDGAVPSTKSGTDLFGRAVKHFEDWQHGISIVRYEEGDGRFALEQIPIFNGWALHNGQEYYAR